MVPSRNLEFLYHACLQLTVRTIKIISLFINQNICCGVLKEPSQLDGSFEHQKHELTLMSKTYLQFYFQKVGFI